MKIPWRGRGGWGNLEPRVSSALNFWTGCLQNKNQSKNSKMFKDLPRVSPGDQPLTKKSEDFAFEFAGVGGGGRKQDLAPRNDGFTTCKATACGLKLLSFT